MIFPMVLLAISLVLPQSRGGWQYSKFRDNLSNVSYDAFVLDGDWEPRSYRRKPPTMVVMCRTSGANLLSIGTDTILKADSDRRVTVSMRFDNESAPHDERWRRSSTYEEISSSDLELVRKGAGRVLFIGAPAVAGDYLLMRFQMPDNIEALSRSCFR